uniref:Uncharacterized protein n=1 Tax=Mycolicibacterium neoaurum VKM Ac-1815D TaxID=700508 RepID=V5XJD7_MYCNE
MAARAPVAQGARLGLAAESQRVLYRDGADTQNRLQTKTENSAPEE